MENEEAIGPQGQGEARPTDPGPSGSPKHNLGVGTNWVHVSGWIHVRAKTSAHAGFPPAWTSTRGMRAAAAACHNTRAQVRTQPAVCAASEHEQTAPGARSRLRVRRATACPGTRLACQKHAARAATHLQHGTHKPFASYPQGTSGQQLCKSFRTIFLPFFLIFPGFQQARNFYKYFHVFKVQNWRSSTQIGSPKEIKPHGDLDKKRRLFY